ncbi:MAG TPA: serine hydrolase domain-containing protein [Acidimicrobiales bacterium]|nr:serine hydrolase domain-containing protein [Acidimicrobiales bacterium]
MTADDALDGIRSWDAIASAGLIRAGGESVAGPADRTFQWASVTKVLTAVAVWVAVEEGALAWEDPAGPPGATLRHLLSHASGLAPDSDRVLAPPGRRRIYSNRGLEVAAGVLAEAAGMPASQYVAEAVLEPLGMESTTVANPAWGAQGPLRDLLALARELRHPTLISAATVTEAASPAYPGLPGVLPGFGPQRDNSWGLGVEVRDHKDPHWTGRLNSPRTFGHFGRSGSFLWVDPDAGVALAVLSDRPFGPWAAEAWPVLADTALRAAATSPPPASP